MGYRDKKSLAGNKFLLQTRFEIKKKASLVASINQNQTKNLMFARRALTIESLCVAIFVKFSSTYSLGISRSSRSTSLSLLEGGGMLESPPLEA